VKFQGVVRNLVYGDADRGLLRRQLERTKSYSPDWVGLGRGPKLPGRSDIRPEDLKSLLPTLSLIDVKSDPLEFRLRLAGTGLYSVYGQEITGRTLRDVYTAT
jgi:hypothetical protein